MATETTMVYIRMPEQRGWPGPTWKINPSDTARIQELVDAGGEIIDGGFVTKDESAESFSDQEIGQVEALRDAIPSLHENHARAIVAAGFTLATLPVDTAELVEIDGIGDATAEKIVEALSE